MVKSGQKAMLTKRCKRVLQKSLEERCQNGWILKFLDIGDMKNLHWHLLQFHGCTKKETKDHEKKML